jgi:NAD(P)-dependent dehydrogenase (short-subunit alcohol dehydrogenase family)
VSRVVLVTGASSGIGRATALACARRGDRVALLARARGPLDEAARECRAGGAAATLVLVADVGDPDAVTAAVRQTVDRFGRLDAVVHAAAVMAYGRVEDVPADVFERVVRTNLLGTANVARAALPRFRAQAGGTLVIVGSLLDKVAVPEMGAYVTGKWGVRGLARVLRLETRDAPGVEVCSVAPAGVDTPIYAQAATWAGHLGQPPPPVDPPEKVALAVLRTLDRPRRERVVGVASRLVQLGFVAAPAVYDALVGPLFRLAALERARTPATAGNVFVPTAGGERLHRAG